MTAIPKIAFISRNSFDFKLYSRIAKSFENSFIVVIKDVSMHLAALFDDIGFIDDVNYIVLPPNELPTVDKQADIVMFITPFPGIEKFEAAKLVSLQYGLAKEDHNYGAWRALADMNLMYGDYSTSQVETFAPSYSVGSVQYAGWDVEADKEKRRQIQANLQLPPDRPNILFMPTWGKVGSFADLVGPLGKLTERCNIIVKMHHNNELKGLDWKEQAWAVGIRHLHSGGSNIRELLSVADLVVSDFSGAIFDAVYAQVPVLMYHARVDEIEGEQKFSKDSLEYRRRDELGLVCEERSSFAGCVARALDSSEQLVRDAAAIREELFGTGIQACSLQNIENKLMSLYNGEIPSLTRAQLRIRRVYKELLTLKATKTGKTANTVRKTGGAAAPSQPSSGFGEGVFARLFRKEAGKK